MRYLFPLLLIAALAGTASDKKSRPTGEAGNDNVDIYATPLLDRDQIKAALGIELPPGIIAIRVKIVPKGDDPLSISRDDFEIISHKDGQRSGPFVPTQIAGGATMVVSTVTRDNGTYGGNPNGPVWGGIPGLGRPRQMPGDGGAVGSGGGGVTEAEAKTSTDTKQKDSPLLAALNEKMLADKETKETESGYLYFPLEGKQKLKDIELIYKGPAGRLIVPFAWK